MDFKTCGVKTLDGRDPGNSFAGVMPPFLDRTPDRAHQAHASDYYTPSFHARFPFDVKKAIHVADAMMSVNATVYRVKMRKATYRITRKAADGCSAVI